MRRLARWFGWKLVVWANQGWRYAPTSIEMQIYRVVSDDKATGKGTGWTDDRLA